MKILPTLIIMTLFGLSASSKDLNKLTTHTYDWNKIPVIKTDTGEKRQVFEGTTNTLTYLEVHVTTLHPGKAPHSSHVHTDIEELIIVKEGQIEGNLNGKKQVVGPGGVILASPGDEHGIWNAGDTPASYYIIRWQVKEPVDQERSKQAGGSRFYDWNKMEFKTTEKGGHRSFMRRPTALLKELEMHVTTLNEGVTSHGEHVHDPEEIILVIKGEVEESINGNTYHLGPGSLILLMDKDAHGIRNAGKGQCEYFAFKWEF